MTQLRAIDEDWTTALAIVAHPDDLEYGAAAAVARWTRQGKKMSYLLVTRGEAGIDSVPPAEAGPLRVQEQIAGAALVGVDKVDFLDYPDGTVTYSLELRKDIARAVRLLRPEVVITGNFHDYWRPATPNQADHIAVGRAVLDGVRDAANRWVFPDLVHQEDLVPWSARYLLVAASPQSNGYVDVTDSFDAGVASLEAHRVYLEALGDHPMAKPRPFLEQMARSVGEAVGVPYAVTFEVIGL
ncbi:MAG: PIG-L deacetylase family protein [Brooklawnia sp.]|uniref:PIG-L deacetylase family protein n=1 Tax=Brooklawnia sp. TaxID=2699740 RepID=UPI003C73F94C